MTDVTTTTFTAEVEDPQLPIEAGQNILVYFDRNHEFMKQSIRIEAVMHGETEGSVCEQTDAAQARLLVALAANGEPVSAESRRSFRVSTVMASLVADLGTEKTCPLLDVSATGFSVVATKSYSIGDVLKAAMYFEGKQFSGTACVQSIKELNKGHFRYGLQAINVKSNPGDLLKGQQQISVAIQREHLRRLRGTA